ncbi:MAG: alpha/beta hydrolase-fold protein [Proteobacteria bacterium]|jgi:enterochelin esterase family protein|nr:alpha/beta hydrolase-fold protein [Pseudomonadota bacterium]MDA1298925.1 alpha/beta hydrolase-fold protein [Pseudomonadota bacterium]
MRKAPPIRDPQSPGYVSATTLPDGTIPPIDVGGNYIVGPTHSTAREMTEQPGVPRGSVHELIMESADSPIFPGISREQGTFGTPDPDNPARLIVTTSHPAPYSRQVTVYVPQQYVPGSVVPFIVGTDGPDFSLFMALDNLIAEGRVPAMVAISISNGGGDAQGSQRGLEYDTMSGLYAEFVETEVLPLVEAKCDVILTRDPAARATMGCSSGASCAMIMAWYRNDLYHRVLSFSGTFVNQQWPYNPETPGGAWEFHRSIIPNAEPRRLRIWMAVADRDLYNPNTMQDGMHDWVLANEHMARVLAEKNYPYQFSFVCNAWHCDPAMKGQLLPQALEYLWQDYKGPSD